MAYAVHTAMEQVKCASLHPAVDLLRRQPEPPKLLAGNDSVLAGS